MKVILEHLDPEVFKWSLIEYRHVSKEVGVDNTIFCNVKAGADKLKALGKVHAESIKQLDIKQFGRMCILDPKADKLLTPEDAQHFDSFVFGGVLGNHPMDGRTEKELSEHFPQCEKRHLGDVQMSTDTAVLVTKRIIVDQIPFEKLEFQDELEIVLDETDKYGFSNTLPYRFLIENGEVVLAEGLIEYLREEDETNQM